MNANALITAAPLPTALPGNPIAQGAATPQTEDKTFAHSLAQQSEAHNTNKDTVDAQGEMNVSNKNKKNQSTEPATDEKSFNNQEQTDPMVWATLFIANESQAIRQHLATSMNTKPGTLNPGHTLIAERVTPKHHENDIVNSTQRELNPHVVTEEKPKLHPLAASVLHTTKLVHPDQTHQNTLFAKNLTKNTTLKRSLSVAQSMHSPALTTRTTPNENGLAAPNLQVLNNASFKPDVELELREAHLNGTLTDQAPHSSTHSFSLFNAPTAISSPLILQSTLNMPLQHPHWGQEFGKQVLHFAQGANDGVHQAELRLDPPELGPLRIHLSLNENVAQAYIVSPHATVRSAIEQALPQLQQAFAQAGLTLGQTDVSEQGLSQQFENQSDAQSKRQQQNDFTNLIEAPTASSINSDQNPIHRSVNPNALVDTFA